MNPVHPIKNEEGSVLVIALIVIVLLTLMGMSATTNSTLELQIAAANRDYKLNFYKAEGAVMEAAVYVEAEPADNLKNKTLAWVVDTDMTDLANWTGTNFQDSTAFDYSGDTKYSAMDIGVAGGSSLDMGTTNLHEYRMFGYHNSNTGTVLLEIGYLRRY